MVELRENEAAVMKALQATGNGTSIDAIVTESKLDNSAVTRALPTLVEKQFIKVSEKETMDIQLTEEGVEYAKQGLPERRLLKAVLELGGETSLEEAAKHAGIPISLTNVALGWVKSLKWGDISTQLQKVTLTVHENPERTGIEKTLDYLSTKPEIEIDQLPNDLRENIDTLRKRKLTLIKKRSKRYIELTADGRQTLIDGITISREVSELTPELIAANQWQSVSFRRYNLAAPVTSTWPGKKQPYRQFLDEVKSKLVGLGFEEMKGPTVETMFFNCDALFMPQDHPAREIHDLYFIKTDKLGQLGEYERFLLPVSKTHENGWKTGSTGWGYKYSRTEALRMILRSQGTAISARTLASTTLKIPGKYFSIVRCFRPDPVDRTHLTEFNQVEGIVVGSKLTLRDLLGVLQRFALDLANADKVRFKPDYFPFTEPSVELQAYKKDFGWLEFGGSGIFRPELTIPLGVTVPVLAWGIGVDRLFMMKTGIDDIRMLFSEDLDWIRKQKVA